MRLIIIPEDTMISIDGYFINECDMSWVPEFTGNYTGVSQKVHAVQWYDDHGEIELQSNDLAIPITELGIFEQAVTIHAERKAILEAEAAEAESEAAVMDSNIDIDALLAELEDEENANVGVSTT